jgi:hypothetical protein
MEKIHEYSTTPAQRSPQLYHLRLGRVFE